MEGSRSKAKVVVLGEHGVGKRSLVHRSAYDPVDHRYVTTLGAKVSKKEIVLPVRLRDGTYIDLILWTVNPSAIKPLRTSLVRGAAGVLAVCDATRRETLADLHWLIGAVSEVSGEVPVVLAVNKWDLAEGRQLEMSDALRFVEAYEAEKFFTSALTGENVEAAFQALGERIALRRRSRLVDGTT